MRGAMEEEFSSSLSMKGIGLAERGHCSAYMHAAPSSLWAREQNHRVYPAPKEALQKKKPK